MTLTPGLSSAADLFAKLRRDADQLNQAVTTDRFFNFVITGYSLIDWIKNDASIAAAARTPDQIKALHSDPWLKVCGDLANASKHFMLTTRKPVVIDARQSSGWGTGRYGAGSFGQGEESIVLTIEGSTSEWTALEFVTGVMQAWNSFFSEHPSINV
jgi:hypothetical protein